MEVFVGELKLVPQGTSFWFNGTLAEAQTSANTFLRQGAQEVIFSSWPSGEELLRMRNPEGGKKKK